MMNVFYFEDLEQKCEWIAVDVLKMRASLDSQFVFLTFVRNRLKIFEH